jgi:DNA-binding MarR family transcriptional regulator
MKDKLFMPLWMKFLIECSNPIINSAIAKRLDSTNAHIINISNELESAGLIYFEKQGRIKKVILTEKGKVARNSLISLKELR